jgi:hypothetical protein
MAMHQILRNGRRLKVVLDASLGRAQSIIDNDVVIRISAKTGYETETSLGPGRVFHADEQVYKLGVVERKAGRVRTGGLISRLGDADARTMAIDCRYPSGSEAQACGAAVEKVSDEKTMKKKTGE